DYDDTAGDVVDVGDLTIMAGLVDSHVHVNEPGRTKWEGFETATRAAAAGGVTTIVDMPLNSIPPVTTVDALHAKVLAMREKCRVDVALWGGAVPGNASQFAAMLDEGVVGFKCFLVDSGVPEFGHLDARGLDIVQRAAEEGVPLTAETTPHYLFFDAESVPDGGTEFKCAPPIREHANRERLWRGLNDLIAIVSDHSPCTPELKKMSEGDIEHAWGGIASLQFALPIVWTEAKRRGVPLATVARLMSAGPAELAGLGARKGRLAPGYDADLVVFDPNATFVVDAARVQHRHKVTPYLGRTLTGVVKTTYLRGQKVWDDGRA